MRMSWAIFVVLLGSTLLELAPPAAALRQRHRGALTAPTLLVACCFAVMFAQDVLMLALARRGANNLWLAHLGTPVKTVLLLLALAHWQIGEVERRAVRLAALGFVALWAVLLALVEDATRFSRFTQPLQALIVVAVATWTMVRRTASTLEAPTEQPWFWIGAGLLLYFATTAVLSPVSNLLLGTARELVVAAHVAKAVIHAVAYLLVARGILCPLRRGSSGGSWSPPVSSASSSPSPSSRAS